MPEAFTFQAADQYGAPMPEVVFDDGGIAAALDWIKNKFAAGALRVTIWKRGGERVSTLSKNPLPVTRIRDLLMFDTKHEPERDVRPSKSFRLAPWRRAPTAGEMDDYAREPAVGAARRAGMDDLAGMITEAVAEELGGADPF